MSKGSARRPRFVPLSELAERWDATFGTRATGIPSDPGFYEAVRERFPTAIRTQSGGAFIIDASIADKYRTPLPSDPDGEA